MFFCTPCTLQQSAYRIANLEKERSVLLTERIQGIGVNIQFPHNLACLEYG